MANIKPVFRGVSSEDQEKFKTSQCLLTISVGQATHEAELFDATIDLINQSFAACIIVVDDSLQRHTMALDSSQEADFFYTISIQEGDNWLNRNKKYYSKLSIPTKILRWEQWLKHPQFERQKNKIKQLMVDDPSYQAAFDDSIDKFLHKYCERLPEQNYFDIERARRLSLDFVIEECAALTLWPELNCQFEVYPSKRNQAMEKTHKRFVLPKQPNLLHPVGIKFKNAKQLQPQCFELL